jgi:hypothetical protein
MRELVPRNYHNSVPVSRAAAKQLARIQQEALVSRAAIAAREQDAAHVVECRIDNATSSRLRPSTTPRGSII